MGAHRRKRTGGLVAALAALLGVTACTGASSGTASGASSGTASGATAAAGRTNVVFVLTDDLSQNLVRYMPQVQALQREGTSFANYTVTDSLCCPSRSSIFTGDFPHDTGVFTNGGADGGFGTFHRRGDENSTAAVALQKAGYRTGMMGKYLNGYQPGGRVDRDRDYVPPGWTDWDVAGNGYPEYDYTLNQNHDTQHYGKTPGDYLTDVLSRKAADFVNTSAAAKQPFFLEVATFAPHAPYTPAPQDANAFPGLKAPRGPAFDTLPADAPPWLASREPLTDKEKSDIDTDFRKRVQAVQSVDRMIGSLRATLDKAGVADHTVVVFSSDNGYHMGEYRLTPGKQTAFDTDMNVPLVAAGPGVRAGSVISQPAQNIDLAPTFETLAGLTPAPDVDGHALTPLLAGSPPPDWRTSALIEHHGPDTDAADPDLPPKNSGNPPSYEALRTTTATYVEYSDGTKEYYDRTSDPDELRNTVSSLPPATAAALHNALDAMRTCHGGDACWTAAHATG